VGVGRIANGHLQIDAGAEGSRPGVGEIGGEAVGVQVVDGLRVAHHEALEAPGPAQDIVDQPAVPGGGDAVEIHVRRHDVPGAGGDDGCERR
jgi:hypothetical protein